MNCGLQVFQEDIVIIFISSPWVSKLWTQCCWVLGNWASEAHLLVCGHWESKHSKIPVRSLKRNVLCGYKRQRRRTHYVRKTKVSKGGILPLGSFWNFWKDTPDKLKEAEQWSALESSLCPSAVGRASVFCDDWFQRGFAKEKTEARFSPVSGKSPFGSAALSTQNTLTVLLQF